jgi:DNA (cytosine-5)-methyltransferase 1
MARIVDEIRPQYVLLENSPLLVGRGLAVVLGDIASLGFDAEWCCISASECGAAHNRDRIWLVAYPKGQHGRTWNSMVSGEDRRSQAQLGRLSGVATSGGWRRGNAWPECQPRLRRVADDLAYGVDRLKALGNEQVPRVAATAFSILSKGS